MSKYKVELYYTGYITHEIEADSPSEAIKKARDIQDKVYSERSGPMAYRDILENLDPWENADEAEEIKEDEFEKFIDRGLGH